VKKMQIVCILAYLIKSHADVKTKLFKSCIYALHLARQSCEGKESTMVNVFSIFVESL